MVPPFDINPPCITCYISRDASFQLCFWIQGDSEAECQTSKKVEWHRHRFALKLRTFEISTSSLNQEFYFVRLRHNHG